MQEVFLEGVINNLVPHLVPLDNMPSAAACYGSQRYFIFQSLLLSKITL